MKFLCVFASVVLAVSCYRVIPDPDEPRIIECGGWDGYFDVVQLSAPESRTIVRSHNFGNGDYLDNEKCFVQFRTEDKPANVRLTFNTFELETGYSCSWDSLCVNGFDYCGTSLDGRILSYPIPANNTFTLFFRSDWSITKSGFEVIVDVVPEEDQNLDDYYQDSCYSQYQPPTPIIEPFPFYTAYSSPDADFTSSQPSTDYDYVYTTDNSSNYDVYSDDSSNYEVYSDDSSNYDVYSDDSSNGDYNGDVYYNEYPVPE